MKLNQVFNQEGNSLIQVIVAGGIMAMIGLGVASMMSNQNKEAKAMGEKLLSYELESQMKALFENSDYCNCAFQGKTFDMTQAPPVIVVADQFATLVNGYSAPPPACTASGGNFIPAVGAAVPGSTMTVGSIGLGGLTLVSAGVYKADLNVGFNNSLRSMKQIKTNVQFSINMAGGTGANARPFVSCSGTGGSGASIWSKNADDTIYYNLNNVGIGTNAPTTKLHVNGEIKVGSLSSGCAAAADLGKIGYNTATHQMEFCGEYTTNGFGTTFAYGWRVMGAPRVSSYTARTVKLAIQPAPQVTNPVTRSTFFPNMTWAGGVGPMYSYATQMPTPNDFEFCFVSSQKLFLKLNDPSNQVEHACEVFNNGIKNSIFGSARLVLNRPLTFWFSAGGYGYEYMTCEFTCLKF